MNFKRGDLVKPKCNKHMEWLKIGIIMGSSNMQNWFHYTYEIHWNTGQTEFWSEDTVRSHLTKC